MSSIDKESIVDVSEGELSEIIASSSSLSCLENDRINLNMPSKRQRSNDLIFNLGYNLRSDIVNTLIKLSALIRLKSIDINHKKELVKTNNDLIKRLSMLLTGINESKLREHLGLISEDLVKNLNDNELSLSYQISCSTRNSIIVLLMENFNFIICLGDSANERDKSYLIEKNKELIMYLLNLDVDNISDDFRSTAADYEIEGKFYLLFF